LTSNGLRTKEVLEVCQTIEFKCAELYHYFAELCKDDRESFLLWLKLAMEKDVTNTSSRHLEALRDLLGS
jgi:hypothetical protein